MMTSTVLSPKKRSRDLAEMSHTDGLDVLVIGGGVTGAGIALDAATRGLRVGIVEAQDWSSGTSSCSSKLVHGGLRYLQRLDFHLVQEALTERDLLLTKLAPHLVKPVPFLYPLEHRIWQRAYIGAGVALYDALAGLVPGRRAMPLHRHRSRTKMEQLFPDFRHDAAIGAVQYWDASVDDSRLVTTLVRTAAAYGALTANRTQLTGFVKDECGRVAGGRLLDLETGERLHVRAKHVVTATGVWTEKTEALSGREGGLRVLASKGIHIVVPRERIRGHVGLILQAEKSVLFIIPWSRYWIIGTTDTAYEHDPSHPVATHADIEYVLYHANSVLETPLRREDVVGTYAGLRPLLQPGTKEGTSSAKLSREHTVASSTPGLTSIAGGKLTTYRVMAKDAVDFVLGEQSREIPSITDQIPLLGAVGLQAVRRRGRRHGARFGWSKAMVSHLLHRYGSMLEELVDMVEEQPDLGRPLEHAPTYLRVEIAHAARHEAVLHLEDVMVRRTRLIYEVADRGLSAVPEVVDVIAPILGWDKEQQRREVNAYTARCEAERAAQEAVDDDEGQLIRQQAPDIVPLTPLP